MIIQRGEDKRSSTTLIQHKWIAKIGLVGIEKVLGLRRYTTMNKN